MALILLAGTNAGAKDQTTGVLVTSSCAGGTYSAVTSPDGSTLSILFDSFTVATAQGAAGRVERKSCDIQVPLNLPAGFSLGVYKVDYRGFSHLSAKQEAALSVDYALGPRANSRKFHRKIQGASDGEFVFSENIGAGLMKRAGCGEAAVLNVAATLELQTSRQPGEAMVALDSVDGAPKGGLVYHLDLKACGK
jgi:hypothetical protein